ncbi:hypothetical protein Bca4012_029387 [Brassica carinata]|uniref:Uncharacterized protein n=2 Tax=Brassica oleracea TaxID=3712 RepID=A0A0D3BRR1_BRAOL|nr:unnamed protein product [Brassica oleracea]
MYRVLVFGFSKEGRRKEEEILVNEMLDKDMLHDIFTYNRLMDGLYTVENFQRTKFCVRFMAFAISETSGLCPKSKSSQQRDRQEIEDEFVAKLGINDIWQIMGVLVGVVKLLS